MRKIFFVLCFFNLNVKSNVILISVPKSGTWLLAKYVQKLTDRKNAIHTLSKMKVLKNYKDNIYNPFDFNNIFSTPNDAIHFFTPSLFMFPFYIDLMNYHQLFVSHLLYNKKYEDLLLKNDFKGLFLIRDPRDVLVSRVNYIMKTKNKKKFSGLQNLSFDELLLSLIGSSNFNLNKCKDLYSSHICYPHLPPNQDISHIGYFYSTYLGWLDSPLCLTVKFEDIIGSKGGGNNEVQINTLVKIAKFLEGKANIDKINEISQILFGGTTTFDKGQIGSWKKTFKREHIEAFKKVGNKLLIQLGYEKDSNW